MKDQSAAAVGLHVLRRKISIYTAVNAGVRLVLRCLLAFGGSFLLAGIGILQRHVPVALALSAALPFGAPAVCAYGGAAVGYLVFWGMGTAFEPIAAGFLILAEQCIFVGILPRDRAWFLPASAATLYALIGFLTLMDVSFRPADTAFMVTRLLLLAVCTLVFTKAIEEKKHAARSFLVLCMIAGCSAVRLPGDIALSVVLMTAAAFLSLSGGDWLSAAAVGGLMLDLTCGSGLSMTAILSLAALATRTAVRLPRLLQAAIYLGCCVSGVLFTGGTDIPALTGMILGVLLALAAPLQLRQSMEERQSAALEARLAELRHACDLLRQVGRMLDRAPVQEQEPQLAEVFDYAAEQVCRSCGKWSVCWDAHASDTYLALSRAACRIWQRGIATREDLPDYFLERCCYADGFLAAVNEALDERRSRRQYQNRLAESRTVVSDQYAFVARLLQTLTEQPEHGPQIVPMFTPDLGYRARGVRGGSVCGDRGNCFTCGEWYYVLLCDGMGTGEAASRESTEAVRMLTELIRAGFEAQDALKMLNGVYVLRGDGGFSTVDLLQISLVSGEGYLHKWGAAPSYIKQARQTRRLGAATPPPGIGVGQRHQAVCLRVGLQHGEMLVLVSDGADPERTEHWVRSYSGHSPRELASGIIGCAAEESDDRTAVVLCLRPNGARKKPAVRKKHILSRFRA